MAQQFFFQFQPVQNSDALLGQLAAVLERRVERYSREKLPVLWRFTDQLNNRSRTSQEVSGRRRIFRTVLAMVCWLAGVLLLFPGLLLLEERPYLLFLGLEAILFSALILFRLCRPLAVGLSVITGIFALLLAYGGIENTVGFLLAGIFFLLLSAIFLFRGRKRGSRYRKEAAKLLRSREKLPAEAAASFCFSEAEMTFLFGEATASLPYASLHAIWETEDMLLLELEQEGSQALLLQKQELTAGSVQELKIFLASKGIVIEMIPA